MLSEDRETNILHVLSEAYSEPCQTSKMESFAKIPNAKSSVFDTWQGSEYLSTNCNSSKFLWRPKRLRNTMEMCQKEMELGMFVTAKCFMWRI